MKRVRKDVCHVWAHQLQSGARYGNIFYIGDTIYSYGSHFPIARHHKTKDGRPCILFTTRGYSSSTSCHMGQVREAIPPNVVVFHISDVSEKPNVKQLSEYADRIASTSLAATRAKSRQAGLISQLRGLVAEGNAFAEAFGFKHRFDMPANLDEMAKLAADRDAQRKRETAAQQRAAKRKQEKEGAAKLAAITVWQNGGKEHCPSLDGMSYLRLSGDGKSVETSRSAVIPVKHVNRVAKLILRKAIAGQEWRSNGEVIRVGEYSLDRIDTDGTVHVGCHEFARSEIERFAAVLGVTK